LVHVAGAVRHPGLYRLDAAARVADAIEVAGGPTPRADLDRLNLAERVVDGARIEVPRRGGVASAPATTAEPVVSVNSADETQLETIPGIGPVTAAAIVAFRSEIGGFTALEQLLEVDGIGPVTFESIRPYVTL
jgi:competence protein ComEA